MLAVGNTRIEIHHAGHAHTPGDSFVWLPEQKIVFSGDIVYTDRMLGVGSQSAHRSWIGAFEAMADKQPRIVVGGHGNPSDLSKATADSYDYLVFLRKTVQVFMDEGRGMEEIGKIDQSRFSYLENFDSLKGQVTAMRDEYMKKAEKDGTEFNPQLFRIAMNLRNEGFKKKAIEAAFGPIDLDELEKEWLDF